VLRSNRVPGRTAGRYYQELTDLGGRVWSARRRSRAKQQPPLFSTIQVCPKDRLTCPQQAGKAAKTAAVAARLLL
jgi:hypothetical protein